MQRIPDDRSASVRASSGRERAGADPLVDGENEDLLGPLTESARALSRLARIEWERAKAVLGATRRRAFLALWELLLIGTLTIAGAVVLVEGITKGLGRWLGAEWAGDLAGAFAILGGAVAIAAGCTARRDRLRRAALRARLDCEDAAP